jgi:hypothetical protein
MSGDEFMVPSSLRIFGCGLVLAMGLGTTARAADAPKLATLIDRAIQQKLDEKKIARSPIADDAEFLRRACIDITGSVPTVEQASAFLDSKDPDKRAKLLDELLARPEYARHMTDIWKDLLIPNTAASARRKHEPMVRWLNTAFTDNRPWNQVARDVLASTGLQEENGAVTFYITHESVDQITDRVARVFLGVQLQCAQCHDHPFHEWKQNEYWGLAAFFTKAKSAYTRASGKEQYGLTEMSKNPKARALLLLPPSLKPVAPTFLGGAKPTLPKDGPYLPTLAEWVAARENPYFAKAAVNRVWQQLFGRGFVEPVDDLASGNKPSHPELLNDLATAFADGGFDLKALIRDICLSQTYQRTSKPTGNNQADTTFFSHMAVRVQSPYQLFDSMESVFRLADRKLGEAPSKGNPDAVRGRGGFVGFFAGEDDATPVEYQAGIPQALYLMNSKNHYRISKAATYIAGQRSKPEAIIETCFLATLSRRPTADESRRMADHFAKASDSRAATQDLLWALLNSTEFLSNH